VAVENGSYIYFTFGGCLLNEVAAVHSGSTGYRAREIVLETVDPIDFTRLPSDPGELLPVALPPLAVPDEAMTLDLSGVVTPPCGEVQA